MVNVEQLKGELAAGCDKVESARQKLAAVISDLEEAQIRICNALVGTGDDETSSLVKQWLDRALKDAREAADITPSVTARVCDYVKRL